MAHTFTKHHFHIVFGTKQRQKLIAKEIRPQLWSYIAAICRNKGILALAIGGIEDHVHLLVELKPDMTVPKAVNLIKSNSSRWMKKKDNRFSGQEGYSSFSVSASNIHTVKRYVLNQEAHHRKRSYEDELFSLLRKHGINFDPEHVFD
jgi:REP element-mobilizing transposase RayT